MLAETKSLNEECGVFGIWGDDNASQLTYFGLHSLLTPWTRGCRDSFM